MHKVVNKIFHHRYLTGLSICLEFWICQCYTGFCRKQPVIHVGRSLSTPWGLNMLGLEYTTVLNMPRLHMVLCKIKIKDSQIEFGICSGFKCVRSLSMLYFRVLNKILRRTIFDRILNIPRFQNMPRLWI